jgi:hypothetical protein
VKLKTTIDVTAAPELTAKAADQVVMAPCRPEVSVLEAKGSAAPGVSGSQANVFEVGAGASHGPPMTMVWNLPNVVGSSWTLLTESPRQNRGMPGRDIGLQGILVIVVLAIVSLFLIMAISSTGHFRLFSTWPQSTWPQSASSLWANASQPDLVWRSGLLSTSSEVGLYACVVPEDVHRG